MPAEIEIQDPDLIVRVEGADKLWALKSHLQIPLENVSGATDASDEAREWLHGIKTGGTHVPGVISAGRFHSHGETVFWDVHRPENAISIELENEHFSRLVLEVSEPDADLERIRQAIA